MYLTPVIYPITLVPEQWRLLYSLNPMVGVVEGARWALLGMDTFEPTTMAVSLSVVLVLMVGGILYFNRTERYFADVI
jgi:lipopolysaccharide transport system permease protein